MQAQRSSNSIFREQTKMQNITVLTYCLSADEKLSVMEALDHIYVTRQYQEMGSCTVCKKISTKKCSGCGTFYCSSECQTFDWPKHRIICAKQRDSLSDRNSIASSRKTHNVSSVKNFNDGILITDRNSPFTALANHLSKKSGNIFSGSKSLANFKIGNKQYQNGNHTSKNSDSGSNGIKECKKNSNDRKKYQSPKKSISLKKSLPDEKKKVGNNKITCKNDSLSPNSKLLKIIETIPYSNDNALSGKSELNLPKIRKMEVIATYRESSDRYWVMDVHNLPKYEKIQAALNNKCTNFETFNPKVGAVCACIFENEWFRGKIVSLTPEPMIHFIDYGNSSNCDDNIFKKLPEDLQTSPGLVFLIEFEKGTPNQYKISDLESLKMTIEETSKTSDGIPRVKVIDGVYGSTNDFQEAEKVPETKKNEKPPETAKAGNMESTKAKSVMDSITATTYGMLFFMPGCGNVRFASIVPENHQDANYCIDKVFNIDNPDSTPYDAKEGDYVLVTDKEGNDQRGKVICKHGTTYYVQFIDCGNTTSADVVYALPEDLKNLTELGVKITIQEDDVEEKLKEIESCFFSINGEATSEKWPGLLKNSKDHVIAQVSLEKPPEMKEWQVQYFSVKCGSTVEISSKSTPNTFYIRSVDGEIEQKLFEMNMDLTQYAQNAKHFAMQPLPGELCCAKYEEDGCFYRAIVNSVEGGLINLLFVDFGNAQETRLKNVKPLPDSMRKIPFFAVKVRLINVSTKPWNNMIKEYVDKLISENVELTLTYKESINNGVILREKVSGIVVNDFIEKAKDKVPEICSEKNSSAWPTPKREEIFLDDDLKYTTISSGRVCVVALLYVNESEFHTSYSFWATVADLENFNYVNGELSLLIKEYCADISNSYEPSFRELCLAEFEGSWYRAICIGNENNIYKVFFVDFGNVCELNPASIRKMSSEFIKAPALAMNCTLTGREKLKGNRGLTTKICRMLLDRVNTLISGVTISKFEEDSFILKIPEIHAILSD